MPTNFPANYYSNRFGRAVNLDWQLYALFCSKEYRPRFAGFDAQRFGCKDGGTCGFCKKSSLSRDYPDRQSSVFGVCAFPDVGYDNCRLTFGVNAEARAVNL